MSSAIIGILARARLRTTPNPRTSPARFYAEYAGGGDVANYLGLLHQLHGTGSGITPASTDATIQREYRRLRHQAFWNALDPGAWWALASAMRLAARGDDTAPVPLPHAGRFRFLPVLSNEWTPSGGQASLEWIMAPAARAAGGFASSTAAPGATPRPRTFSFIGRRGRGPSGAFGALGAAAEDLVAARRDLGRPAQRSWRRRPCARPTHPRLPARPVSRPRRQIARLLGRPARDAGALSGAGTPVGRLTTRRKAVHHGAQSPDAGFSWLSVFENPYGVTFED